MKLIQLPHSNKLDELKTYASLIKNLIEEETNRNRSHTYLNTSDYHQRPPGSTFSRVSM